MFFFFFSSRRRHTRLQGDWSSDVCSSDLRVGGCPDTAHAFKALGYRETLRHLRGELSLEEAIALTRRNTRRYAKRQWTWFRKEEDVAWFAIDPSDPDRFSAPLGHAARALGRG